MFRSSRSRWPKYARCSHPSTIVGSAPAARPLRYSGGPRPPTTADLAERRWRTLWPDSDTINDVYVALATPPFESVLHYLELGSLVILDLVAKIVISAIKSPIPLVRIAEDLDGILGTLSFFPFFPQIYYMTSAGIVAPAFHYWHSVHTTLK